MTIRASSTVEDYLKCIFRAEQEARRGGRDLVSMGRIAALLEVAPASVTGSGSMRIRPM